MSPSESAFLALGLLLGIAAGAAIVMVLRNRPPTHQIRVTIARDAIPRRASTLASDVLHGAADGPAPGGPGDRRLIDRDGEPGRTSVRPDGLPVVASPILPWIADGGPVEPALAQAARPTSITIRPEPDPVLAALGIQPAATAVATADDPGAPASTGGSGLLAGLLAGDHGAIVRLVDAVGGADEVSRRAWDTLLTRAVDAMRERTIDLGMVDLPMGNPFWDTFTIDQCRQIVVALQASGRRYDGRGDWADNLVPGYRDLTRALADCGIDARRVRAWPNSLEIAELFRGARVATAEAVGRAAPTLDGAELQAFLGARNRGLDELWPLWDAVRMTLGVGPSAAIAPVGPVAPAASPANLG